MAMSTKGQPLSPMAQLADGFSLLERMMLIRFVEEELAQQLEAGEVGCPVHLYTGQEAVAVGVCDPLRKTDYVLGGHRSHGHYLAKGGDLKKMVAEIYARATGCSGGRGGSMHLIDLEQGFLGTVPLVGATISLTVGAAMASVLRGEDRVAIAFFGDGAAEEGTMHESLNLAAQRRLPVIFVCENNFYASHMRLDERRAKDNLVELAAAHGMDGVRVDGNDVLAVRRAAHGAISKARNGDGPTFFEARTFRWRGHVGPSMDLDVGVKRRGELRDWVDRDPIELLKSTLREAGAEENDFLRLEREVRKEVETAVDFARNSPSPSPETLLRGVLVENERGNDAPA